jgi:hypothetical protein
MALATYTDLKSAIANWLARPDDPTLTPFIPDFITLAETRINRDLRLRAMETRATASLAGAYVALPPGFLEMRNFQLNTNPVTALSYVTPQQLDASWAGSSAGRPAVYTIIGDAIQVGPAPDAAYDAEMAYYKKIDALSPSRPANRLLTDAPDIYLYASLLEATPFLMNDERLPVWSAAYENAVRAAMTAEDRARWGGSVLQVRADRLAV